LRSLAKEEGWEVPGDWLQEEGSPAHLGRFLPPWMVADAEAYEFCGRGRGQSGYITTESILAYCQLAGIVHVDERFRLMRVLMEADSEMVKAERERKQRESKQNG
jgi:hypothetical protein